MPLNCRDTAFWCSTSFYLPCLLCFGNTLKLSKSLLDGPGKATSMPGCFMRATRSGQSSGLLLGFPELGNFPVLLSLTIMPRLTPVVAAATSSIDHIWTEFLNIGRHFNSKLLRILWSYCDSICLHICNINNNRTSWSQRIIGQFTLTKTIRGQGRTLQPAHYISKLYCIGYVLPKRNCQHCSLSRHRYYCKTRRFPRLEWNMVGKEWGGQGIITTSKMPTGPLVYT